MSRSYRKNPYVTDQQSGCTKEIKRYANRKVRRALDADLTDKMTGKSYRKYSESWNIRDYSFYDPTYKKAVRK